MSNLKNSFKKHIFFENLILEVKNRKIFKKSKILILGFLEAQRCLALIEAIISVLGHIYGFPLHELMILEYFMVLRLRLATWFGSDQKNIKFRIDLENPRGGKLRLASISTNNMISVLLSGFRMIPWWICLQNKHFD